MRSRSPFAWVLAKEWRELWASRAWWLMLAVAGPLTGVSFINAVQFYAELSGYQGTAEGVGEAFSPLVGVWAPTFSTFGLIATFLFPFVVIRLVGGDRQSGVFILELPQPMGAGRRIAAKALVLLAAWAVAMTPAIVAIGLWRSYGGATYAPEILAVTAGQILNAALTIALGAAAAALTEHPATAAIATLAVTVGTWVISFFAALKGGAWDSIAAFTPPAMVAQFQHGLVRADVTVATLALVAAGLAVAAVWIRLGVAVQRRAAETAGILVATGLLLAAAAGLRSSADLSENRQNSFGEAEARALASISAPLEIDVHLAPEDARRGDLERMALAKLRRVMPHVTVRYISRTSAGVFEQNTEQYGEIVYRLGGKTDTNRLATAEGVLETIFGLAGVAPGPEDESRVFRGHPLAVPPRHAAVVFYGVWPAVIAAGAFVRYRRHS